MINTIATPALWTGFAVFVVVAIAVDLLALERKGAHAVTVREAVLWSILWVVLSLIFCALLWYWVNLNLGPEIANQKATEFLTGYVIEKSLSVDNIFVFLMLFGAFAVPTDLQKRALIIGVIGAVILRAIMILIGAWLLTKFSWLLYVFGAFLVFTGMKMLLVAEHDPDIEKNPFLHWMRGHLAITKNYVDGHLTLVKDGKRWFTPLFLVVTLIGITDVIFAVDSIPAIFAITTDPFIVMTSNIFAVLGLRALFFLLADMAERFHLLKFGLAFVLTFIGSKMLIVDFVHIPVGTSLAVVGSLLVTSIIASLARPVKKHEP